MKGPGKKPKAVPAKAHKGGAGAQEEAINF